MEYFRDKSDNETSTPEPEYRDRTTNSEQLNNFTVNNNPAREFFDFIVDLLKTGLIVFVIAFALRYFAIQPFIVDGESMMPNFVNNEYLLAEKISYLIDKPKRGDVIVFKYPKNTSVNYIKRVIGLPGETVKIESDRIVIINAEFPNGIVLSENYIPANFLTATSNNKPLQTVLGNDQYFVLGDNREHSSDSREWGILPKSDILGRAWLTILPFDRFGLQHKKSYQVSY
ncbi:MAG: signal peptidase I [bacterium]